MESANGNKTGAGEVTEHPPSRPGIKFVLCVAGAAIALLVYIFTH